MITVKEYAEQNSRSVVSVMSMIHNGTLAGEEREAIWYVDPLSQKLSQNITSGYEEPSVFYFLNALSILVLLTVVGIAIELWPESPSNLADLIPPVTWLTAGIVPSILLAALAQAITYLSKIEFNTRKA